MENDTEIKFPMYEDEVNFPSSSQFTELEMFVATLEIHIDGLKIPHNFIPRTVM